MDVLMWYGLVYVCNIIVFQMTELEVSKQVAERTLREHKGDIIKALHALTE